MKTKIISVLLIFGSFTSAQVALGKTSVDGDGILDFEEGTTSGLILPRVDSPSGGVGTLLYDVSSKKVLYNNGGWIDLSIQEGAVDTTDQDTYTDAGGGVIIGSDSSTSEGVLVLESTDKALILPKIASPELNVINPEAGMICYDTVKKNFAVYNGSEWTFWSVD